MGRLQAMRIEYNSNGSLVWMYFLEQHHNWEDHVYISDKDWAPSYASSQRKYLFCSRKVYAGIVCLVISKNTLLK